MTGSHGPLLAALFSLSAATAPGSEPVPVEGIWITADGAGWVQLEVSDGELRGRIIGSPPGQERNDRPDRDIHNPQPGLRSRPLKGLTIIEGFQEQGGRWVGGTVYDPDSGRTYKGTITVVDRDTLRLRGYIGISLFGRTETWRRRAVERKDK